MWLGAPQRSATSQLLARDRERAVGLAGVQQGPDDRGAMRQSRVHADRLAP